MTEYQQINQFVEYLFAYGSFWVYAVIWLACFVENIIPPFPGDTFIFAGGALVALGRLDLVTLMIVVNVAGMASVMLLYEFGRKRGRGFFMERDYKYFSARDVQEMSRKLDAHGTWVMLISRFVVGVRAAIAVAAGIGHYSAWRTLIFSLASYLIFTSLVVFVSMKVVHNFDRIRGFIATYNWAFWIVVVSIITWWIVRRYRQLHKRKHAR